MKKLVLQINIIFLGLYLVQHKLFYNDLCVLGAQWLSGRVLDSRPRGRWYEPHRRHHVVSLSKNINPSLVLVQPRKTHPFITERLLMGRKETNQTKQMICASRLHQHCLVTQKKSKNQFKKIRP